MEELTVANKELKATIRQLTKEMEKKDAKIRKLGIENFNLRDTLTLRRDYIRERLYLR